LALAPLCRGWALRAALAAIPAEVLAQGPAARPPAERVALVVGNARYAFGALRNPVRDAQLVSGALRGLGYTVTMLENAPRASMLDALAAFILDSAQASSRVLFYAGHGAQYRGRNYLIPVDAQLRSEDDLPAMAVDVHDLTDRVARIESGVSILFLDACRSVPALRPPPDSVAARGYVTGPSGLAGAIAPHGVVVAFSTAPGRMAADEINGQHSPFAHQLVAALHDMPGAPVELLLKRIREGVMRETGNQQVPWDSSSLIGDFCFQAAADGSCTLPSVLQPVVTLRLPASGRVP
jgi:uncharacterized caspase-like protein